MIVRNEKCRLKKTKNEKKKTKNENEKRKYSKKIYLEYASFFDKEEILILKG